MSEKKTIALCAFFTAGYNRYFRSYYESFKKNFFPEYRKTFFIFTDNPYIQESDVVRIDIPTKGFDHKQSFYHLNAIAPSLKEFEHVVVTNGNMIALKKIGLEYHPEDALFLAPLFGSSTGLAHIAYDCISSDRASGAFIDRALEDISCYWRGGLYGGTPENVIAMAQSLSILAKPLSSDAQEQFINRYFVTHAQKAACLDHRYIWSGGWGNNPHFDIRIVCADKVGRYEEMQCPISDERKKLYAKVVNGGEALYIGRGEWKTDLFIVAPTPPRSFLHGDEAPRYSTSEKIFRQLCPPILVYWIEQGVAWWRRLRLTAASAQKK